MRNDTLYTVALLDERTTTFINQLKGWLTAQGIPMGNQALPPHLLLYGYPIAAEKDILHLAADAAAKTRGFAFSYSHIGIVPDARAEDSATLMLAPEVNRPLLALRERFVHSKGWTLHTPLMTISPQLVPQVLPYVLPNVKPFDARVSALAVIRQDGVTMFCQQV